MIFAPWKLLPEQRERYEEQPPGPRHYNQDRFYLKD